MIAEETFRKKQEELRFGAAWFWDTTGIQEKGREKQMQRQRAQRDKIGLGCEGQKDQGEEENENKPGHR